MKAKHYYILLTVFFVFIFGVAVLIFFFIDRSEEQAVGHLSQKLEFQFLPKKLKVILPSGITVRESSQEQSKSIATAYANYIYEVFDGLPGYYKIKFLDDKEGWIFANFHEGWTELNSKDMKVKILLPGGITVRAEPYNKESERLGVAAHKYSFEVVDILYSRFEIRLPENNFGWIYAGKPSEKWVEIVE